MKKLIGLACAAALLAPTTAAAREPKLKIEAEWITPECVFPARFSVTLRNVGDEAFAVPLEPDFGPQRPINMSATLKEGVFAFTGDRKFSTEYFFLPPYRPRNVVDLAPGEQRTLEMSFDGIFDAHGGVRPTYDGRWRGWVEFYYFLPSGMFGGVPEHTPPILSSARDVSAWSNSLECA